MKTLTVAAMVVVATAGQPAQASNSEMVTKRASSILKVTMDQLITEAANNSIAAEQKYKGKRFQITGLVKSLGQLPNDEVFVEITDATETVSLIAHLLPSETKRAVALSREQIVDLQCIGIKARTEFDLLSCKIIPRTQ